MIGIVFGGIILTSGFIMFLITLYNTKEVQYIKNIYEQKKIIRQVDKSMIEKI